MTTAPIPRKSLGQHWLTDRVSLQSIVAAGAVTQADTVLEIGPGLGTLTALLVASAKEVIAVELDDQLFRELPNRVPAANLTVLHQDILQFDLTGLPPGYVIVANIPYYLTSNLIRLLSESTNPPRRAVLLVQKEVAERVTAVPGAMSILSVTAQWFWRAERGLAVPARLFTPPPKVDSQILVLNRRPQSPFPNVDTKIFFNLVKAGFSQRRKTLLNSLSAGLHKDRAVTNSLLEQAGISPGARAQSLSLEQWHLLYNYLTR
jgi:16S rRNA (adenine1518-N6/adenine1519-N6)-dimethyltransferase